MRNFFAACTLILLPTQVMAGETYYEGLAKCAPIASDAERQACFAALPPRRADLAAAEAEARAVPSPWQVETEVSAFTDTLNVTAILLAKSVDGGSGSGSGAAAALRLSCQDEEVDLAVSFGDRWFYDQHKVFYRVDSQPAKTEKWTASSTKKAAFAPAPMVVIKNLAGAERLVFKSAPINEAPIQATFDLAGIDAAIRAVRTACSW